MASGSLAKAMSLLDGAERELDKVRLDTPKDYMENSESRGELISRMRAIDGENLEPARSMCIEIDGDLSPVDSEKFWRRLGYVNQLFNFVAGEAQAGRLPMLKEAPWPPHHMTVRENMRADAAQSEADDDLRGYEERSNG